MKRIQYALALTLTAALGYFVTGCASHGHHHGHGHSHGQAAECCGTCGGGEKACCSKDGKTCCHGGAKSSHKH